MKLLFISKLIICVFVSNLVCFKFEEREMYALENKRKS